MVKKVILMLTCVCICGIAQGQMSFKTEVDEAELNSLRTEFQELVKRKDVQKAVEKGAQVSELLILSKNYKEASNICIQMDNLIYPYNRQTGKTNYYLLFLVAKERLRLYTQESDAQKSKTQLDQMNYCIRYMNDDSHTDDILLVRAEYYHRFGMEERSLEAYEMLLQRAISGKGDQDREYSYQNMITYAERNKHTQLGQIVQSKYTAWQDSVQMVRAAEELKTLKGEHEAILTDLQQKERTISNNQMVIIGLWTFIIAAIAAFVILFFLFLRSIYRIRKLKKSLTIANESNAQKSAFVSNISSQITPSLEGMEHALDYSSASAARDKLADLKKNISDMQTYISLEEVLDEPYPVKNTDISLLCKSIMEKVKPSIKEEVESSVDAPRISIKTNTEALEQILGYLLSRSSKQTKSGKILLEFKKRNARTGQFIITDTGTPIDPTLQEDLFKPFGLPDPAMKDDNWGLPICKLIAHKLNGTLKIDAEYKRGTRFILDLCS